MVALCELISMDEARLGIQYEIRNLLANCLGAEKQDIAKADHA